MHEDLYDLCETISREIGEANDKIRAAGGKLSGSDVEYVDKLTHTLKSIKTILAMEGAGYSEDRYGRYDHPYERGSSYERGRTGNVRRDNMGRYSRDGYSHNDGREELMENLRALMEESKDSDTRREIQQFMAKVEKM